RGDFAEELGAAVGGEGSGRIVDLVRCALRAIEHEVCREVDETGVHPVHRIRHELDRRAVDRIRDGLVRLGVVHARPRGAVDDDVRPGVGNRLLDEAGAGDIELGAGQGDDIFAALAKGAPQIAGDHAGRAGDEPLHAVGVVVVFFSSICFLFSFPLSPSRKLEMPSPSPLPSCGSLPAPNTTRMMAKITSSSGNPSEPNIEPPKIAAGPLRNVRLQNEEIKREFACITYCFYS